MDLSTKTEVFNSDDQRWLGSQYGTDTPRPVTLDVSLFTEETHYKDGWIRSGVALAKVADSNLYGPSDGTANVDGFLLTPQKVHDRLTGKTSEKVAGALLDHGKINRKHLPVQSGAGSVAAGDSNPHFIWV